MKDWNIGVQDGLVAIIEAAMKADHIKKPYAYNKTKPNSQRIVFNSHGNDVTL